MYFLNMIYLISWLYLCINDPLQKQMGEVRVLLKRFKPASNFILLIVSSIKAILLWWFLLVNVLVFKTFVLLAPYVRYHIFS